MKLGIILILPLLLAACSLPGWKAEEETVWENWPQPEQYSAGAVPANNRLACAAYGMC